MKRMLVIPFPAVRAAMPPITVAATCSGHIGIALVILGGNPEIEDCESGDQLIAAKEWKGCYVSLFLS